MELAPWEHFDPEKELKKEFAVGLLHRREPLQIALTLFHGDFNKAFSVSQEWPNNRIVLFYREQLLNDFGEEHFLPSHIDVAWELYAMANEKTESGRYILEGKERIAAYEQYAKIRGFYDKANNGAGGGNVVNNVNVSLVNPDKTSGRDAKIIDHEEETNVISLPQIRYAK